MVAIAERERQIGAWKQVNKSIPTATRKIWQGHVDAFHKDRSEPNPYLLSAKGMRDVLFLPEAED
jgi:hypothetical protein